MFDKSANKKQVLIITLITQFRNFKRNHEKKNLNWCFPYLISHSSSNSLWGKQILKSLLRSGEKETNGPQFEITDMDNFVPLPNVILTVSYLDPLTDNMDLHNNEGADTEAATIAKPRMSRFITERALRRLMAAKTFVTAYHHSLWTAQTNILPVIGEHHTTLFFFMKRIVNRVM